MREKEGDDRRFMPVKEVQYSLSFRVVLGEKKGKHNKKRYSLLHPRQKRRGKKKGPLLLH